MNGAGRCNFVIESGTKWAPTITSWVDETGTAVAPNDYSDAGSVFAVAAVATGSRPSAATVGAGGMIFDSTLGKPIWSDGANWVDATGATV